MTQIYRDTKTFEIIGAAMEVWPWKSDEAKGDELKKSFLATEVTEASE